jgi:hypothetical protein
VGGSVLTDAFGVVAMVAMTPLLSIQLMGLIYARQTKSVEDIEVVSIAGGDDIIDYEEESSHERER